MYSDGKEQKKTELGAEGDTNAVLSRPLCAETAPFAIDQNTARD